MVYVNALILATVLLFVAVDDRHVVILRAIVHHLVATTAECLRCISVATKVDECGLAVVSDYERANVVVVVTLGIVATLGGYQPLSVACHHYL